MGTPIAAHQTAPPQHADPQRNAAARVSHGPRPVRSGISRLQSTLGNRMIHRLLRSSGIQTKLTVGPPDDAYEREADRVAAEVMRMPDPRAAMPVQRAPVAVRRLCPECDKEEQIRPKCQTCQEGGEAPSQVHEVLSTSGVPLDSVHRAYMEPRLGHDFSNVRIHADARAAESADAIGALAYTVGPHIVFAAGRFHPHSTEGRHLLAHELTHVVQQGAARVPQSPVESAAAQRHVDDVSQVVQPAYVQVEPAPRGNDMLRRAWNSCGTPDDCPPRNAGEQTRAAAAALQVGALTSPEVGEIVSHFPIGSSKATALASNATWTAFVAVSIAENSRWEILGFSDCQGGVELNSDLRTQRAQAVHKLLPAAARAKIDRVVAAPVTDCVGTNETESERSLNRSVVFRRTTTTIDFEAEEPIEVTIPKFLCGPDVTAQIAAAVAKTNTTFAGWSSDEKDDSCDALDSLLGGGAAWDIVDLHRNAWIYTTYRPLCATAGASPPCGSSVQVDNDCHYAGSANYVIFGTMCRLCAAYYLSIPLINTGFARFTKTEMLHLIDLYKGSGFTGLATPSANFAESVKWAVAGYDGWPSGASSPAGDRSNCAPKCPTPYAGGPFTVYWDPHTF